jgi:hypothetical protein
VERTASSHWFQGMRAGPPPLTFPLGSVTMTRYERLLLNSALLLACASTCLVGCHPAPPPSADALVKRGDQLYVAYLSADLDQARRDLQDLARLGEAGKLAPIGQARWLFFDYSRLFVLEQRAGHQDLAEIYFAKARYWDLRQRELRGDSEAEIAAGLKAFTPQSCKEFVDKWDKDHTDGKGPRYIQDIPHS